MRKLGIDITFKPTGGVLAQINQLILNLESYDFEQIIFYTTPDNKNLFENINSNKVVVNVVPFSSKSLLFRTIWAQMILPVLLIIYGIDILFCPGNISPIINVKKKVQWIGTIGPFEKNFISFFSFKSRVVLFISKYLIIFSSYTSDMVIFESNYTRDMFVKRFKQKISNSAVIHIGNDIFYKPVETCSSEVLNKYKSHDFILTVSHLYPYKNLELLIDSYNHLKLNEKDIYILVAGSIADQSYFNKLKLKLDIYDISKYVIFLGRVNSFSLREMYSQCKFFVFTSPYENFAYTLIEAMSCASPIITTNTTAMPETCGDAALYFSPDSEKELSEHILSFLNDENLRLKYKNMAFLKASEYAVFSEVNNKTNALLNRVLDTKED